MANIDWLKIKNEYIHTLTSFRKLAEKYGVNKDSIALKAKAEGWRELRDRQTDRIQTKTFQKTSEKIASREAERMARISSLADKLIDKLEIAIEQADQYNIRQSTRMNVTTYNEKNQAVTNISTEKVKLEPAVGIIDKSGLKKISTALKDVRDIGMTETDDEQFRRLDEILDRMGGKI